MTWRFVGVGTSVESLTTSITLTEPTGCKEGDLLVAGISTRTTSTTSITLPANWALIEEQKTNNTTANSTAGIASGLMAYIVRGSSAPSYVFTIPAGISVALGRVVAYRGNTATPLNAHTSTTLGAAATAISVSGLTTVGANELIVEMVCGGRNITDTTFDAATDPGTDSGTNSSQTADPIVGTWQERADVGTSSGADTGFAIADAIRGTAGATGNLTCTASASAQHVVLAASFTPDPFDVGPSVTVSGSVAGATVAFPALTCADPCVVIVQFGSNHGIATSITDQDGLTWVSRKQVGDSFPIDQESWYAKAPIGISNSIITVHFAGTASDFFSGHAVCITGVDQSSPFDPNASVPGGSLTTTLNVSTTRARSIIVASLRNQSTTQPTAGSGWNPILSNVAGSAQVGEWKKVFSPQTNLAITETTGSGDINGIVVDALVESIYSGRGSGAGLAALVVGAWAKPDLQFVGGRQPFEPERGAPEQLAHPAIIPPLSPDYNQSALWSVLTAWTQPIPAYFHSTPRNIAFQNLPTLCDIDLTTSSLNPLLTFTRAGSATDGFYTDANGSSYNSFGTNAPRINVNGNIGLLLESARTNRLLNSDAPVTQTTASLGTGTYILWVIGSGSATSSAGTATGSAFGAASSGSPNIFTLSVAGTVTVTVSGSLTRFQLENGVFPTSYIVTAGVVVTRAVDTVVSSSIPGFTSSQGTLLATGQVLLPGGAFTATGLGTSNIVQIDDATNNNRITLYYGASNQPAFFSNSGNVTQNQLAISGAVSVANGVPYTSAVRYSSVDFRGSANGTLGSSLTGKLRPTSLTRMVLQSGALFLQRVAYWSNALSDADFTAITIAGPPFSPDYNQSALWSVLSTWTPVMPLPTLTERLVQGFAASADNPPFAPDYNQPTYWNALTAWTPPPPAPWQRPPLQQQSVDNPLFGGYAPSQPEYLTVLSAWTPPPPMPWQEPETQIVSVDNPIPFGYKASQPGYFSLLGSWIPPDPAPWQKPPHQIVSVDNPTPDGYGPQQAEYSIVLGTWVPPDPAPTQKRPLQTVSVDNPPYGPDYNQPQYWSVLTAWIPPDPAPWQKPATQRQSVDNPPVVGYVAGGSEYLSIIGSWVPPDPAPWQRPPHQIVSVDNPTPTGYLPTQPEYFALLGTWTPPDPAPWQHRPSQTVSVDNPPVRSGTWTIPIQAGWIPPDPSPFMGAWQPLAPWLLPSQLTAVAVNDPPFLTPPTETSVRASWEVVPPLPTLGVKALQPFISPPVGQPTKLWTWLSTILSGWVPPDPLPTLPRWLPAQITAVRVDTPIGLTRWLQAVTPDAMPVQPRLSVPAGAVAAQPHILTWLTTVLAAWGQVDTAQMPRRARQIVSSDNPPLRSGNGQQVSPWVWQSLEIVPTLRRSSQVISIDRPPIAGATWLPGVLGEWKSADPLPAQRLEYSAAFTLPPVISVLPPIRRLWLWPTLKAWEPPPPLWRYSTTYLSPLPLGRPSPGRYVFLQPELRAALLSLDVRAALLPPDVHAILLASDIRGVLYQSDVRAVLVQPESSGGPMDPVNIPEMFWTAAGPGDTDWYYMLLDIWLPAGDTVNTPTVTITPIVGDLTPPSVTGIAVELGAVTLTIAPGIPYVSNGPRIKCKISGGTVGNTYSTIVGWQDSQGRTLARTVLLPVEAR